MVLKLAKQLHMSTFTSSQGRKVILRKIVKYMMRFVAHFSINLVNGYFITTSDQIKLTLFLAIID
jgi:hypothetical protein